MGIRQDSPHPPSAGRLRRQIGNPSPTTQPASISNRKNTQPRPDYDVSVGMRPRPRCDASVGKSTPPAGEVLRKCFALSVHYDQNGSILLQTSALSRESGLFSLKTCTV